MDKLTNRQKQSISTKLKITGVATELFKNKGFENVTIQDICNEADISVGAFYHHFESKHEIINKAYEQIDLLVKAEVEANSFNSNVEKIIFILSRGCKIIQDLGWIFVSDVYKNLLHIDGKYSLSDDRYITVEIIRSIDKAKKVGELKESISSKDLTNTLMRTSRGIIFDWCLHQGGYDLENNIIFDLDLILSNFIS